MSYSIIQLKNREYQLEYAGDFIFNLTFPSWKNSNANVHSSNGLLQFTKKSFWKSQYDITKNDNPIGKITSNWKGYYFIHFLNHPDIVPSNMEDEVKEEDYTTYRLKHKGILKHRYELYQNKDPRPLITFRSKTNWFKINFEIELPHSDLIPFPIEEVLATITFCAILIRKRQAAAAGGAA